jgi:hypothetical protein
LLKLNGKSDNFHFYPTSDIFYVISGNPYVATAYLNSTSENNERTTTIDIGFYSLAVANLARCTRTVFTHRPARLRQIKVAPRHAVQYGLAKARCAMDLWSSTMLVCVD